MLNGYLNYLENLAKTPNEYYREQHQATINDRFDDTTVLTTVEEESENFDFKFHEIEVWLGTVTESSTNAEKDSKDYRSLYFKDCTHDVGRGRYYHFDKNYWIVYESTTELESQSNCKIQRCNTKLKWIDKDSGQILEYPCATDYVLSATQPSVTQDVTTIGSRITLLVQGNDNTRKIKKNTRFIFGDTAYKFNNWDNFRVETYDEKEAPLLFMHLTVDTLQPNDDLENGLADANEYIYTIKILEESFSQIVGFKGKLNAEVTLNGQVVERNIIWKTEDENIVTIDEQGNYELIGEVGQSCKIYACIENSNTCAEITIGIKQEETKEEETVDIVIEPLINELSQYDTVTINANLYVDGEKQEDIVECVASGLTSDYYYLNILGNNQFQLASKKSSKTPLILTFTCGEYQESIEIELTSLF